MGDYAILARGLSSGYEVEHLARVFLPGAGARAGGCTRGPLVYARAGKNRLAAGLRTPDGLWVQCAPLPTDGEDLTLTLCRLLYGLLRTATGTRPPWGLLTGVRPLRLMRKRLAIGGAEEARRFLVELCDVAPEKFGLLQRIEEVQRPLLESNRNNSYSLYISIPFCPSRCNYCSFVSQTIRQEGHLMPRYVDRLVEELAATAALAQSCGLRLETVYIGGGTPTALALPLLEKLLQAVETHFGAAKTREYTVEAGRPDCTDLAKLELLKRFGVSRISINPQSLNDTVLQAIGRRHTADDIRRCFEDARRAGHGNINMDLIAGLPTDDESSFEETLGKVLAMAPENITLHALTLKRAADLSREGRPKVASPATMLAAAFPRLDEAGYRPYYLYRQKSGVENLENTGWARPGTEGLYNIYIMEETHTILAVGAGASTKLVGGGGDVIKRIYNHKLPLEYLQHFNEILARKKGVSQFYAGYLDTQALG